MDSLRKAFDNLKPHFSTGGKYEKWWVIFDVVENFFYSSIRRTFGSLHIRDASDVQRVMVTVMVTVMAIIMATLMVILRLKTILKHDIT